MSLRRSSFALIAAGLAVTAAACGNNAGNDTPGSGSSSTSQAPASPGQGTVTDQAAQSLCSGIRNELSNWRVQGPTLGKPGLNIVVQTWAMQNGVVNIDVLRDRAIVDRVTTASCPDVRQQAMEALQIPDLASGLVGI